MSKRAFSLNPIVRLRLARNTYGISRSFCFGRLASVRAALGMLFYGHVPRRPIPPDFLQRTLP